MFCLNPVRYSENVFSIYDALHGLIPFVQFEKREKRHGVILLLLKLPTSTSLKVSFSTFLNFADSSKSRKATHVVI